MATISFPDPLLNTNVAPGVSIRGGEVMDQHMLVYIDPSDGNRVKMANCRQNNPFEHIVFGLTLGAVEYINQPVHVLQAGNLSASSGLWVDAGELFVLSQDYGEMMNMSDLTHGDWVTVVGYSTADDAFTLDIHNTEVEVP